MLEIAKLFYEISLFRKSPQDVPKSLVLQYMVMFVYVSISFLMLYMSQPWFKSLLQVGLEIILVWVFCKTILFLAKKTERFQQTFTALIGIDALISFIAFPALSVLATPMPEGSEIPVLAFFIFVALILWHWVVTGYIVHHALSEPFSFGLGVALLYLILSHQIIGLVFPEVIIE